MLDIQYVRENLVLVQANCVNRQVKVDVAAAIAKLRELEGKRAEAEARMNGYLKELGYDD